MGETGLEGVVEGMVEKGGIGSEEGNKVVLGDVDRKKGGEGMMKLRERGVEKGRVVGEEGGDKGRGEIRSVRFNKVCLTCVSSRFKKKLDKNNNEDNDGQPVKVMCIVKSSPSQNLSTLISTVAIDTSDNVNPLEDIDFNPLEPAEGFVAPPSFDDGPLKTEDEIAATYEELYGPTFNGVSVLGNDVFEMDALVKRDTGFGSNSKKEKVRDGFEDRVVQVRRVTKVVKGGKQLRFRVVFIVGNKNGQDCIGVGKTKEVVAAIQKSASNARRNIVKVPMTKYSTFPHSCSGFWRFMFPNAKSSAALQDEVENALR
ncbi:uncharacterized protein LOC128196645 [Vigna angularis]|uniref:uncharacterized protein LOC128196645 n=1 Tax=Phaseolus angularis TaxID=3914 RepID=UPI0022B33B2B|nr:uncharacterized protein LOC128196645 [Vigna angularis]